MMLEKMRASIEARLIADWHKAYRFSSVQLAALAGVMSAGWEAVPGDVKDRLPPWMTSAFAMAAFASIIVARVTKKSDDNA